MRDDAQRARILRRIERARNASGCALLLVVSSFVFGMALTVVVLSQDALRSHLPERGAGRWLAALGLLLLPAAGAPVAFLAAAWDAHAKAVVEKLEAELRLADARNDSRPPILLLSSFSDPRVTRAPGTFVTGTKGQVVTPGEAREASVAAALATLGEVVAVAPSAALLDGHALVLRGDDVRWREAVAHLATGALAVVVVPGSTPGAVDELAHLARSGMPERLVVVMPPVPRSGGVFMGDLHERPLDVREAWDDARRRLAVAGLHLPPHRDAGLVYLARADLSVGTAFETDAAGDFRAALLEAVRAAGPGGRPLATSLAELESRGLVRPNRPGAAGGPHSEEDGAGA